MARKIPSQSTNGRTATKRWVWTFIAVGAAIVSVASLSVRHWVKLSAPQSLSVAEAHLKSGNNEGVEETLSWLLWFEPENARALLLRGISRNARKNTTGALDDLSRIPEDGAEFLEGGIALAATLVMDGQLDRAEQVLLRHLDQYPGAIESRERLSALYLTVLCHPEAMSLWEDHWALLPDDLSVLPRLFDIRCEVISPPQRLPYVTRIQEQHAGQERVLAALGILNAMSGNTESAEEYFRQATSPPRCVPENLLPAARFFLDTAKPDEAQKLLDRYSLGSTNQNGREGEYWHLVGRVEETGGNPEAALAAFRRAVANRSDEPVFQLACARILRRLGRTDEAKTVAQKAQELSESKERLIIISLKIDRNRPNPDDMLTVSKNLAALGLVKEAQAWQQVSESLKRSVDQP
jgi:tetratricopeptide (TPR) repeat protein